jgi:hypothetical protein
MRGAGVALTGHVDPKPHVRSAMAIETQTQTRKSRFQAALLNPFPLEDSRNDLAQDRSYRLLFERLSDGRRCAGWLVGWLVKAALMEGSKLVQITTDERKAAAIFRATCMLISLSNVC